MLKVIQGNLLTMANDGKFDFIAQGCNCFNVMGGGIAAGVKKVFPEAYEVDKKTRCGDIDKLGTNSYAKSKNDLGNDVIIANCYSQYDFGFKNGVAPIDYEALENCLLEIEDKIKTKNYKLGLPMIGYGLAGGDLIPILEIFYNTLNDLDATIVIFDQDPKADKLVSSIIAFFSLKEYNKSNKL